MSLYSDWGGYEVSGLVRSSRVPFERYYIDSFDRREDAERFADGLKANSDLWDDIQIDWVDYEERFDREAFENDSDFDFGDGDDYDGSWDEDYDYFGRMEP